MSAYLSKEEINILTAYAEIHVQADFDDQLVNGAFSSGNDAQDRADEAAILKRLNRGDVWAWARVRVIAAWAGLTGSDVLGGCSYANEAAFKVDGYYQDMVNNARAELAEKLHARNRDHARNGKPEDLETFTNAYIECALWSTTDESDESGGEPLDSNFSVEDLSDTCRETMRADCAAFYRLFHKCWQHAEHYGPAQAGHDFWLTRNGHGTGFWDRDHLLGGYAGYDAKTILTEAARGCGEVNLYVSDAGEIECD